jgi:hypothetical protein
MGCRTKFGMKIWHEIGLPRRGRPALPTGMNVLLALVLAVLFGCAGTSHAQVASPGLQRIERLSVGVFGSGDTLQYGPRKMLGYGAFVDGDTSSHIGIEGEGRWIEFHQRANVHAETYSIGGRYHFVFGRLQPYAKGLVGFGNFTFPYNYAQGRYLIVTAGAGLDYRWTHRVSLRADFEYQDWPQFTYGNMTSLNGSVGFKVRIF